MTRERRQQPRTIPAELGFIQISGDEGGRIVNISEAGLCFETFAPVARQRRLQFWFSLDLRERVEASGRLTWLDARGKVGGLRFLDLSARGLRHLRAYLGASAAHPVEEPSAKLAAILAALERKSPPASSFKPPRVRGAVALPETYSVANRWSAASTTGLEPPFDSVARSSKEDTRAKGAMFFAALTAERARRESTNDSEIGNTTVLSEEHSGPRDFAGAVGLLPAVGQLAVDSASSPDATGMVSLEWHLLDSRRQLRRGIFVGVLVSLIFAIAGGRYFARKPSGSERGISPAIATLPVKPGRKSGATPQELWVAAQKGNTAAAVELADRFLQGDGVPVNCAQARVLLLVASEKNNADAIRKLGELTKNGCPKP